MGAVSSELPRTNTARIGKKKEPPKFVYYVYPESDFCSRVVSEYLGDMSMSDGSRQLLCLDDEESIFVWRVSLGFLKSLDDRRRKNPSAFAFRAFRHPKDDRSAIKPYRIGGTGETSLITRQDKRCLGRAVGIHSKVVKKRKR